MLKSVVNKNVYKVLTFSTLLVINLSCTIENKEKFNVPEAIYENIEFDMPRVKIAEIPDYKVSILDFGAVPDGKTENTTAIAKAIEHVSGKGGGTVVIPRGIWLTGPIILKSNINLHAQDGALIIFSGNFDLYPLIETSFEGLNTFRCISPIYAKDAENIAITGKGIFDGSGNLWRPVKQSKLTESAWNKLVARGGVLNDKKSTWYPSLSALKGSAVSAMNVPEEFTTLEQHLEIKDFLRPVMISIVNCKKVYISGVGFQNSPAWCLHPLMSEDIVLSDLVIRNPWYAQNGDGLDLESCKNVVIYNCSFDVGDDGICFKSGKNEDGLERGMPNENVIVKNCVVYHGHGGFVIGSEMSGGMKNIHVSNCTFMGTDIGIRFKSTRGRGGVIENIYISNIDMIDILTEAIRFNMFYGGNSPVPEPEQVAVDKSSLSKQIPPVSKTTPVFKDISIKNVICKGARRAIELEGLPEMNLSNVLLEDINITAEKGMSVKDVDGLTFKNVVLEIEDGPVVYLNNSKNINGTGFKYEGKISNTLHIEGEETKNIILNKQEFGTTDQNITIDNNVPVSAVKLN